MGRRPLFALERLLGCPLRRCSCWITPSSRWLFGCLVFDYLIFLFSLFPIGRLLFNWLVGCLVGGLVCATLRFRGTRTSHADWVSMVRLYLNPALPPPIIRMSGNSPWFWGRVWLICFFNLRHPHGFRLILQGPLSPLPESEQPQVSLTHAYSYTKCHRSGATQWTDLVGVVGPRGAVDQAPFGLGQS